MLGKIEGRSKAGDRGWDGWMASLTQWTWVWANPGRWWRTRKPGVLQSMGSQRVGHNWVTEQQQSFSWCYFYEVICLWMDQPWTHDSTWARKVPYPRSLASAPHQDCRERVCKVRAYTTISHRACSCAVCESHAAPQRKVKAAWPQRNGKKDFDFWFPVPTLSSLSDLSALPALASLDTTRFLLL